MSEPRLNQLVRELEKAGYPHELSVKRNGRIRCGMCGEDAPAERWKIAEIRRLEGPSDPADEVIVLGLVGPKTECGCRGTLVLGYGPSASREDSAVLVALDVPRAWRRPGVGTGLPAD